MTSSAIPVVVAQDLRLSYHDHPVLNGVDLSVTAGEVVGVVGPSGSGKSTLLRVLAGIERPDSGSLTYADQPAWISRSRKVRYPRPGYVTAVFQDATTSLDPLWSLRRILTEPFLARGRPATSRAEMTGRIESMLDRVALGGVSLDIRPAQLSGGQQQRVAMARCLLAHPALLIADEPTSALDVTNSASVISLLRDSADEGTAVVAVSHDRRMLETVADRLLECANGKLAEVGTWERT